MRVRSKEKYLHKDIEVMIGEQERLKHMIDKVILGVIFLQE